MNWLILVTYEIVALLASRIAYSAMRSLDGGTTDKVDAAMVGFMALVGGHFWPLAAPVAIVMWHPRKTPAELKTDNERMQKRIVELERELGIGGTR